MTETITYAYDALNRLTQTSYSDVATPTVTYAYDGVAATGCTPAPPSLTDTYPKGRRTAMCDGSGATSWSHDQMGRILTETRTIVGTSNVTKSVVYAYNLDGSVSTIQYPGTNKVVTYQPGGAGRPLSAKDVADGINYATGALYAPPGALRTMVNGGVVTVTNSYNSRVQPVVLSAATTGQTVLSLSYDFHVGNFDNGNLYQVVNNRDSTRTQNFTYDNLNRLAQAWSSGPQWGETFSVDPWGSLWQRSGVTGKTYYEALSAPANLQNQLTGFGYDVAGNMIQNGSVTYTYDGENRLTATAGWTYVYDGDGVRVKKSNGSTGTLYWTGTGSEAISESDLAGTDQEEYIFFGKRIGRRDVATNAVHYYFSDHLGSASVVTNASGGIEDESDYYPYGGEMVITATVPQNYKFTGKERDAETGLDYFGARHYGSSLGRFMQADPVTVTAARQVDPQQMNLYAYVRNNPLKLVDPTGMTIDETQLSEKDLEKWQEAEKLAAQKDSDGNLLHPELYNEIVSLQQDSRTYTLQGASGLSSDAAGEFKITQFTSDGKDFTAATIKLDFSKVLNGKGVTAADFNLGYDKFGGLNDNARRFAELVGHEFAHGLFSLRNQADATGTQQLMNERDQMLNALPLKHRYPLPPDVMQKIQAAQAGLDRTEKFAQQQEKIINGELKASQDGWPTQARFWLEWGSWAA